jgi:hypothetical protein
MPSTQFKDYLEMIGLNEPITKKARFWSSYVNSLRGTSDIRAQDTHKKNYTSFPEASYKSIYDDPRSVAERITSSGYHYTPEHRNIYGLTPRRIGKLSK